MSISLNYSESLREGAANVLLSCNANAKPSTNLVYRWWENDVLLPKSTPLLKLDPLDRSLHHNSIYVCEVQNAVGTSRALYRLLMECNKFIIFFIFLYSFPDSPYYSSHILILFYILIRFPDSPRLLPTNQIVAADEGGTAVLSCPVDSNPPAAVVWTKIGGNGNVLHEGTK